MLDTLIALVWWYVLIAGTVSLGLLVVVVSALLVDRWVQR